MNYDNMTRDQLIALIEQLTIDSAFGIINRNGAMMRYNDIEDGRTLILLDLCNLHALNHKYTNAGVDQLIRNVVNQFRHDDSVIRYGGDELVIILNSGNGQEYVKRFDSVMHANDMYAVYAIVTTSNGLENSVAKADELLTAVKVSIELNGMKPDRNQPYELLDSHVISE